METVAEKKFSVEEYFALEEKSEIRHEFYYGEIIEMPGETTIANLIAGNIYVLLRILFKKTPFMVFDHDIKLMVHKKSYRYPDLVVIHQKGDHKKYVTDPVLIVEVLSESTEDIDRDKKRLEYFGLSSLQYYLTIHQDEPVVEIYTRSGKSWQFDFYTDINEKVSLPFFDTQISLQDIFEGVSFEKKGE
ncbi:MAG: Uma2 family endonuclease [Bacteroidetes bacterium]|nr:Uma2 family endonuclease [Bacteroidota bacterium]